MTLNAQDDSDSIAVWNLRDEVRHALLNVHLYEYPDDEVRRWMIEKRMISECDLQTYVRIQAQVDTMYEERTVNNTGYSRQEWTSKHMAVLKIVSASTHKQHVHTVMY